MNWDEFLTSAVVGMVVILLIVGMLTWVLSVVLT